MANYSDPGFRDQGLGGLGCWAWTLIDDLETGELGMPQTRKGGITHEHATVL